MNKLKNKPFLAIYLVFSFVVIVAALIVSLTIGLNLGTDLGGGTQFEVTIESSTSTKEQSKAIKDVLSKHHIVAEKIYLQDKLTETNFVVKINKHDIANEDTIRSEIATKLKIDVANVSEFADISSVVTKKAVIWTSVTVVCLLLLVFVASLIRYKVMAALGLTFSLLHNLMLSFSVLALVRVPINFVSLIIVLCATLAVLFAEIVTLERVRENMKLKHNNELSIKELITMSKKSVLKPLILFAAFIMVLVIVLVCVPVAFVQLSAVSLLICMLIAAYSYYFVGNDMYQGLLEIKQTRDKLKLSKNNSPEPSKELKKSK